MILLHMYYMRIYLWERYNGIIENVGFIIFEQVSPSKR